MTILWQPYFKYVKLEDLILISYQNSERTIDPRLVSLALEDPFLIIFTASAWNFDSSA